MPETVIETPDFKALQYAFTAHIRDPETEPLPDDVEDRRMGIYRDLFFNNVKGFINSAFPVLKQLYPDAAWEAMARDFFKTHRSHSPYFAKIAEEFLDYLQNEHHPQPEDPAFLIELAHYEWVELALSLDDQELDYSRIDRNGDLLHQVPVLSPQAWLMAYKWPVHQIRPDYIPKEPPEQPTYLLVYRNRHDRIGFSELNPVTARLVERIQEQPEKTGLAQMQAIAQELNHPEPQVVIDGGIQILQQLREQEVVVGCLRNT